MQDLTESYFIASLYYQSEGERQNQYSLTKKEEVLWK